MRRLALVLVLIGALPAPATAQTMPAARYRVPQPFTPPKPAPRAPAAPVTPTIELPPLPGAATLGFQSPAPGMASGGASADVCRASATRAYYACLSVDASDDSCQADWARQRSACSRPQLRPGS